MNLAHKYVKSLGKSIDAAREEYDGACIDFAGDVIDWLGYGGLAYFNDTVGQWKYHAAVEVDGLIHCLWMDEGDQPIPTDVCADLLGASYVDYPAEKAAL